MADLRKVIVGADEMAERVRAFDWSQTPVGPIESWSPNLVHYVNLVLSMPSPAVIFWGPEQTHIYNTAYTRIMGPRHPRHFGGTYRDCWPDTYELIQPWMRKVLDNGETVTVEKELIACTRYGFNEEAWFSFTFSPLHDEDGRINGIFQPVFEVTDTVLGERRAETLRALAPRADSLDPVADAVEALARSDRDLPFSLLYLWDDVRQQLGLAAFTPNMKVRDDTCERMRKIAGEAFASNAPVDIDELETLPELEDVGPWPEAPRSALALPIGRSPTSAVRGAVVFGISPRLHFDDRYRSFMEVAAAQLEAAVAGRRALQEAQRRVDALAEIDRAKTEFFSNVSHEFRTPLTLMLGPVEDLLAGVHGRLAGTQHAQLEMLHRNAQRLQKLVDTLLEFSRIEAGRMAAEFQPVDLAAFTGDIASTFRSVIEGNGLVFDVGCETLAEPVYVDTGMWEKVVLNLLSNAFKFTFKGRISIEVRADDDHAELVVADTGIGIPEKDQAHLFERFHRVRGARGRTSQGTGIGMALVKELVRLHGGSIHVESRPDLGSRFTVRIPFGTAHLPADQLVDHPAAASISDNALTFADDADSWSARDANPAGGGLASLRLEKRGGKQDREWAEHGSVLLVDDNADIRDYMARLLEPACSVRVADDGEKALAAARREPPDLVLIDVMMPGLDGLELLKSLRTDPRTRAVPVILISARADEEARVEGLRAGADDYLTKPFSARELRARVNTQLQMSRLRRAVDTERRHLHQVFDEAPVAVAVWSGPEHVYELVNTHYEHVFNRRNVIGKTIRDVFPEPELERLGLWNIWDRVYATGETFTDTGFRILLDRNGTGTPEPACFSFTLSALRDSRDEITGLVAVAVEIEAPPEEEPVGIRAQGG